MGRTDDVINVAGHRLSTGSMEAVLAAHPAVAECAVIGVHDALKGQLPRGLVVLKAGVDITAEVLRDELVAAVRREIGPVAAFRDVSVVDGAAEDPLGQDPAQDDARYRRRPRRTRPVDHRGPRRARRASARSSGVGGRQTLTNLAPEVWSGSAQAGSAAAEEGW